jgi:hypothetical protein
MAALQGGRGEECRRDDVCLGLSAKAVWRTGDINAAPLANNMLLDRDAERWRKQVEGLKAEVGACAATEHCNPFRPWRPLCVDL